MRMRPAWLVLGLLVALLLRTTSPALLHLAAAVLTVALGSPLTYAAGVLVTLAWIARHPKAVAR
jgi:hypothetical protein